MQSIRLDAQTDHHSGRPIASLIEPWQWSESQLVEACLQNEEAAWRQLLDRYGRLIYIIALRFSFSQSEAEEIYQDVCLTIFEKLATLREPQHLLNWLATITRHQCIRRLRERNYTEDQSIELTETSLVILDLFTEEILLVEQHKVVQQAFALLEPRCRQLLQALFFEPLPPSYEDLAAALQVPTSSIGSIRQRCLEKLRAKLLSFDTSFDIKLNRTYPPSDQGAHPLRQSECKF